MLPLLTPQTCITKTTEKFPIDKNRLLKNLLKSKYHSCEKHILNYTKYIAEYIAK